jgi:hypothetical protein
MKWALHRKIGIILLIAGIAPFTIVELMAHAHNWTPVDVPVALKPGEFRSPEFKTDLDGRYLVSLAVDQLRGADMTKEQCMMGVGSKWDCDDVKWTLQFDWQIIADNGAVIQSGVYEPIGISGTKVGFAELQGHRNSRQRVTLKIQKDAGDLNNHHPRLVVEAGPESYEALPYLNFYSLIWAAAVGVLGLLMILLPTGWRALNKLRSHGR